MAAFKLGELISGLTAGNGREGAGEADLRIAGDDPKEDLREDAVGGGSIGSGVVIGVPGFEGAGDAMARDALAVEECLWPGIASGGAGLCADTLLPGKSILLNFPWVDKVHVPSFSFKAYICTVLSEDCVATNSFRGSQATPCI